MMDHQRLLDLLPDYVLGLLSAEESAELNAVLASDRSARDELAAFLVVMEGLAFSAPHLDPPPSLEEKLRQATAKKPASGHQHRSIYLLVAAALILLVAGYVLLRPSDDDAPTTLAEQFAALGDDPNGVTVANTDDAFGVTGALRYEKGSNVAILQVKNLPPITDEQTYQVWIVDEYGPVSGGKQVLPNETNYVRLVLEKPVDDYVRFGMTIEPASGSPFISRPSGTRIFNVQLRDE